MRDYFQFLRGSGLHPVASSQRACRRGTLRQASEARRGLAEMASLGKVQVQLSDLSEQIGKVLQADVATADTAASLVPVLNTFGQETGTLLNVTA